MKINMKFQIIREIFHWSDESGFDNFSTRINNLLSRGGTLAGSMQMHVDNTLGKITLIQPIMIQIDPAPKQIFPVLKVKEILDGSLGKI